MVGFSIILVLEALLTALAMFIARRLGAPVLRSRLLILLPVPLLACAAWGLVFAISPASPAPSPPRPAWIVDAIGAFAFGSLAAGLLVTSLARGFRIPAGIFSLLQVTATFFVAFLVIMQVTGTWL